MISGAKRARTADLLHAMQALYQLSYSPGNARATGTRTGVSIPVSRTPPNIMDTRSAVVAEHRLRQRPGVVLDQPPLPVPARHHRPGAVGQRPDDAPEVLGEAQQARGTQSDGRAVAHHDGEGAWLEAVGDPLYGRPGPLRHGHRGLALRRPPL